MSLDGRTLYWSLARALWWSHRVMWKCIDGVQRHRPQYDQHGIAKQSYIDAFIDACIALLLMAYDKLQKRKRQHARS